VPPQARRPRKHLLQVSASYEHRPTPGPVTKPALRLFVAGDTPGAKRALDSRKRLIEAMAEELEIEIVDILEHPAKAEDAGILATPTLSDDSVTPPRRLIGDISNIAQVLEFFSFSKKDVNS